MILCGQSTNGTKKAAVKGLQHAIGRRVFGVNPVMVRPGNHKEVWTLTSDLLGPAPVNVQSANRAGALVLRRNLAQAGQGYPWKA